MKILLVCMQYDYGDPGRGASFEYGTYFHSLQQLGHDVVLFDFMEMTKQLGKDKMNAQLVEQVMQLRPELTIFSLYRDEIDPAAVQRLKPYTTTLGIFYDDTWRGDFTRFWGAKFDWFTSPDLYGLQHYAEQGFANVIHFPFGCNETLYYPQDVPKRYDVSFVGGWHPYRAWLVGELQRAGVNVVAAGWRWPMGKLGHEDLVRFINESRINLNLSNSTSWDLRYLRSSWRAVASTLRSQKTAEQLKARHFELNACGAFQLSFYVEGLEKYYRIGEEISIYTDPASLLAQVRYYLAYPEEREAIARAGLKRTLEEHTFRQRFNKVIARIQAAARAKATEGVAG